MFPATGVEWFAPAAGPPRVPLQRRPCIPPPFDRGARPGDRPTGPRINDQIRLSPIRLIGANGEQLGIVPTAQAMEMAREQNLDLVEVAATERPPVCMIMD